MINQIKQFIEYILNFLKTMKINFGGSIWGPKYNIGWLWEGCWAISTYMYMYSVNITL